MIERGKRVQVNPIDDAMICPSCGSELIYANGIQKCKSCEYQCEVSTVDYAQHSNKPCMICGNPLLDGELQVCSKCKAKITENWRQQNGKENK